MPSSTRSNNTKEGKTSFKTLRSRFKSSIIWTKITKWEYWPFEVFYAPVAFYLLWISIRARSLFFFTAANPSIEFGGMLGESKDNIYKLIPKHLIPKTNKVSKSISKEKLLQIKADMGISYPLILKPDIGERGWMVKRINNEEDLCNYLDHITVDFLIQEYIEARLELGVFYYRYPDSDTGTVSSVVIKGMLTVVGDGKSTVYDLIQENVRAKMQINKLMVSEPEKMKSVPDRGEAVELVSIGNHSLGTTFLNGNHLINQQLVATFDRVSKQIEGFYFGRYDIRCNEIEDLYQEGQFKILELNGAGAEPAHIYHPGFSLYQAYRDVIHHLRVLVEISMMNRKRGVLFATLKEGIQEIKKIRNYNKHKVV